MKKSLSIILAITAAVAMLFTGCTQTNESFSTKDVSLSEIHQAVKDAYGEDYYPDSSYLEDTFFEQFGINPDIVEEYIAECPQISVNIDTFVAVKSVSGQGKNVENALNQYRDNLQDSAMQYPMNRPKIAASQVIRHGDYVFFVMLGQVPADVEESGDEAAIEKSAKEQVQIGVQVIDKAFQ